MTKLVLIDSRVKDAELVISSLMPDVTYLSVDYETDTLETLKNKIAEINVTSITDVAIFQENYYRSTYKFLDSFEESILENIETIDANLDTWASFKNLIDYFVINKETTTLDLLGCCIGADANWLYVINNLSTSCNIQINSSVDNTGSNYYGGNWILESNNTNLINKYFTENISNYKFILGSTPTVILDFENNYNNTGSASATITPSVTNSGTTSVMAFDTTNKRSGTASLAITTTTETSHMISIPITTSLTGGMTQSIWFRYTGTMNNYNCLFTSNNLNYAGATMFLGTSFTNETTLSFQAGVQAGTTNLLQKTVTPATYGISNNGNWNHVAWSITPAGAVTICINGQNVAWGLANVAWTSSQDSSRYLGGRSITMNVVSANSFQKINMTGNIDNVKIYDTALTLAEMQGLYTEGKTVTELKAAGYTATQLKSYGYTATQLKGIYTLAELKTAAYTVSDLYTAGYTATEMKAASYTATQLYGVYSAADLKNAGYTIAEIKAGGYGIKDIKTAGFTVTDMSGAGYTQTEMRIVGYTASEMKAAGYSATQLSDIFNNFTDMSPYIISGLTSQIGSSLASTTAFYNAVFGGALAASSNTGQYAIFCNAYGIFKTNDYGISWVYVGSYNTTYASTSNIAQGCCMSSSGQYQFFTSNNGYLSRSSDYGATWSYVAISGANGPRGCACSSSGQYVVLSAGAAASNPRYSADYGQTFTAITSLSSSLLSYAVSDDGYTIYGDGGTFYKTTNALTNSTTVNASATWTTITAAAGTPSNILVSTDGSIIMKGLSSSTYMLESTNSGSTFSQVSLNATNARSLIGMSKNGRIQMVASTNLSLYTSKSYNSLASGATNLGTTNRSWVSSNISGNGTVCYLATNSTATTTKMYASATYTASELRDASFNASELKTSGFTASEMKTAGFSLSELSSAGYTSSELLAAGYTIAELLAGGSYTVAELKTQGYTASQLKDANYTATQLYSGGYTIAEMNTAGYTATELKTAGCSASDLITAGYTGTQLYTAGYTATEMKSANYTAAQLKALGYTATQLYDASYTALELKNASFTTTQIYQAGYTVSSMKTAGFSVSELYSTNLISISSLKTAGFTIQEICDSGSITVKDAYNGGYSKTDVLSAYTSYSAVSSMIVDLSFNATDFYNAGYDSSEIVKIKSYFSISKLKTAGYSAQNVMTYVASSWGYYPYDPVALHANGAGYSLVEIAPYHTYTKTDIQNFYSAGYRATDMHNANFSLRNIMYLTYPDQSTLLQEIVSLGYTITDLHNAVVYANEVYTGINDIFTLSDLKSGGYTAADLRADLGQDDLTILTGLGYNATDLKGANFTALELKVFGFTVSQLNDAGYTGSNLHTAGVSLSDILGLGYSESQARSFGYSADDMKAYGYTITQVKTFGYTAIQVKEAGYSDSSILSVGYTASELNDVGYTAIELKASGYTAQNMYDAGYTASNMRTASYTAAQLKLVGYTISNLYIAAYTATEMKSANYTATELKGVGYTAQNIYDAGYSATEMKTASYNLTQLKNVGFTGVQLKESGFTASEMKSTSYTASDLKSFGYTSTEVKEAGYSISDMRTGGFNVSEMLSAGFTTTELKSAGYSATEMITAGYSATDLLAMGYNGADLKAAGYTATALKSLNYNVVDLKTLGYAISEIRVANFTITEMTAAGYSSTEMKSVNYTAAELRGVGYTGTQLKIAGYTSTEMKAASYSASELKVLGYTASDLQTALYSDSSIITIGYQASDLKALGYTATSLKNNYTVTELINAGYTSENIISAGYTVSDLRNAGYTITQLKIYGYPNSQILTAGYSATELKAANYTASELKAYNYTLSQLKTANYTVAQAFYAGFTKAEIMSVGYTVNELKIAGFTSAEVRTGGFTPQQLLSGGYTPTDILTAGYSANVLYSAGYSLTQLKNNNYSDASILAAGFPASSLYTAGYTASQLFLNGYSALNLRDAGYLSSSILSLGYTADNLRAASYSASELKSNSYTALQLITGGYSKSDVVSLGYTATELKAATFTASELRVAGFTISQLQTALYTDDNILSSGFTASSLKSSGYTSNQLCSNNYTIQNLKDAGYNATEIITSGYNVITLRTNGYTSQQLKNINNYPVSDLKDGGYSDSDILSIGYSASDLKLNGYSVADLKSNNYTALQIKTAGYSDSSILSAGFNASQLKLASYTSSELKTNGYNVSDLKTGGYSTQAILTAGYNASELRTNGYTSLQLKQFGYTVSNLISGNYSESDILSINYSANTLLSHYNVLQLKTYNYTPIQLKTGGFNDVDILNASFSATLLKSAGYSASQLRENNYSISDLVTAGYTKSQIISAGYIVFDLKDYGYTALDLKPNYSIQDLIDADYSDTDILTAGYSAVDLKSSNYTATQLYNNNYTATQLKSASYIDSDIIGLGYTISQLKVAGYLPVDLITFYSDLDILSGGFSATSLKDANYSVAQLKDNGYSVNNLKTANYNNSDILSSGYSATELKQNNYAANDLKNNNYTASQLKDAGYLVSDLKAAGYTTSEILFANYLASNLLSEGYTSVELKNAFYSALDLKTGGYSDEDILSIGYTVKQLTIAGYTVDQMREYGYSDGTILTGISNLIESLPSPPTITNVTTDDSRAYVHFTDLSNSEVPTISYKYTLDGGVTSYWVLNETSPLTIIGLTNGTSYDIGIYAVNRNGMSAVSNIISNIVPSGAPTKPFILNPTSSEGTIHFDYILEGSNGSSISEYYYSLDDVTYTQIYPTGNSMTINGLTNNTTYNIYLKVKNGRGMSDKSNMLTVKNIGSMSIPVITDVSFNNRVASVYYTIDTSANKVYYKYSLNNGSYLYFNNQTNPLLIHGLSSYGSYNIKIRAESYQYGESTDSNTYSFESISEPSKSFILTANYFNGVITLNIIEGSSNGSDITNYYYSINNGSYSEVDDIEDSIVTIHKIIDINSSNLIKIKSLNSVGYSELSNELLIEYRILPDKPIINSVTAGDNTCIVNFTNGSVYNSPILCYKYKLSNDTKTYIAKDLENPLNILELTNGTNYTIKIKTVCQSGESEYSSLSETFMPFGVPSPPTITSVEPRIASLSVNFTPGNNGGLELLGYKYSINSGPLLDASGMISPILIPGLSDKLSFSVTLYAYNSQGLSIQSNTLVGMPGVPTAPTINSITTGDGTLYVNYTPSAITNGSAVSKMYYTFNKVSYNLIKTMANPLVITGVQNGKFYNLNILSLSSNGYSPLSNTVENVIINVPPAKVIINSVTLYYESPTTCYATVVLKTPVIDNGSPITKYSYAIGLSSNTFIDIPSTTLPLTIPGLPVNTSFSLKIKAINLYGSSSESAISKSAKYILGVPSKPVIKTITTSFNSATISFLKPASNGADITTYKYSLNSGPYISLNSTNVPFNIPIDNNVSYNIQIKATNPVGDSEPSSTLSKLVSYVYLPPLAPKITSIIGSNNSISINFIAGLSRGASTTSYSYSFDNGLNIIDTSYNSSPINITGLANDASYNVMIYANSNAGQSSASNVLLGIPIYSVPSTPSIKLITPLNNSCSVDLNPVLSNGSPITTYLYSVDGGVTLIDTNRNTSPILITDLTNGTLYNIQIIAVNTLGNSQLSLAKQVTPIYDVPTAPTITKIITGTQKATIYFNYSVQNGSAISSYYYSIDNGATKIDGGKLISPIIVSNLSSNLSYTFRIYAKNDVGYSNSSNAITVSIT